MAEIVGTGEADWPEDVVAQVLHAAYVDHAHAHGDRRPLCDDHMAERLAKLMPDGRLQPHPPMASPTARIRGPRAMRSPLDDCRAAFLTAMQIDVYRWPEVDA